MTSILEALRELEEERRRARTPRTVSVADAPADPPRATGLLYPLIAGLAVGVLAVGLAAWWLGVGTAGDAGGPVPEDLPQPPGAAAGAPRPAGLAWLERADAPTARIGRDTPAHEEAAPRRPDVAPTAPASPAAAGERAGAAVVESIRFTVAPERRSVTLRLDGRRVTLRQGERAAGIEVQLILEDGVYLDRGSDVIFATPD